MNKQTEEALRKEESALKDLFETSKIDADVYRKGLIRLASEYVVVEAPVDAMRVLRFVNTEYINNVFPDHMREDQVFRQMTVALCEKLLEDGWIYMGQQFNFSKPPALA